MAKRERSRADTIKRGILRSRNTFWHPSDLDLPSSTAGHILRRLVVEGELRHVRKGIYWRGTMTPLGMSPPPTTRLIRELVGTVGVGESGLAAANRLGMSTQIPRILEIAIPGPAPKGELGSQAIRFVSRASRTGRVAQRLTGREVALLEMLADLSTIEIGPRRAWETLLSEATSGRVRLDRLARAAKTEPATSRARLARLLEATGHRDLAGRMGPLSSEQRNRAMRELTVIS